MQFYAYSDTKTLPPFNKICMTHNLTPKYARINIRTANVSSAAKRTYYIHIFNLERSTQRIRWHRLRITDTYNLSTHLMMAHRGRNMLWNVKMKMYIWNTIVARQVINIYCLHHFTIRTQQDAPHRNQIIYPTLSVVHISCAHFLKEVINILLNGGNVFVSL
jgi:hypothetical protein